MAAAAAAAYGTCDLADDDDAAYDTCDTDTVSLASTVASELQDEYVVERIVSDGRDPDDGVIRYLVKWQDYGWHRCTWEPAENLAGTNLLQLWAEEKRALGKAGSRRMKRDNEARFERAVSESIAAKERRAEKRAKRRQQREQARPVVASDDSDDDVPLIQHWQTTQAPTQSPRVVCSKVGGNDTLSDSLFYEDQELQSPGARPPSLARKLPLYQSSSGEESWGEESSSSDAHTTDDPLLEDAEDDDLEVQPKMIQPREIDRNLRQGTPEANMQVKDTHKTTLIASKPVLHRDIGHNEKTQRINKPAIHTAIPTHQKVSGLVGNAAPEAATTGASTGIAKGTTAPQAATTGASTGIAKGTTAPQVATPGASTGIAKGTTAAVRRPSNPASMSTIKSSVAGPRPSGIKMINQPKTHMPRQWQHGDKLYSKLKFRGIAEKRSRVEGTPDVGALEFVNGSPRGLVRQNAQAPTDDPYGRREVTNRRVQESRSYSNSPPRRHSTDNTAPLESWESNKIPLVCSDWRLGNSCVHGPLKCLFLHRNKDNYGRDIKVAPVGGSLPPKYRQPPLTCPYWLEAERGCKKSADQCDFAHINTGWRPLSESRPGEPLQIDRNQVPVSNRHKKNLPPSQITCWYWKNSKCRSKPGTCIFQHFDTGNFGNPPPRATTCRKWLKGKCRKTAKTCRFAHVHIGDDPGLPSKDLGSINPPPFQERRNNYCEQPPADDSGPAIDFKMEDVAEHVLPGNLNVNTQPPTGMKCLQMKQHIEKVCKLDFTDMFTSNRNGGAIVDRRAFLLYHPQDHAEELDLITRWLLLHHVEVGNAWYDGSWDHFKQQIMRGGTGVIIAHPDFEYFSELPDFGQVLKSDVRLWSVGLQASLEYDLAVFDSPSELRYDRIEIFPLGGFIYITDEIFEKKPQLALKIVELFFAKIRKLQQVAGPISPWHKVDDAAIFWRLCMRPELMRYLFQTCEKHEAELEAGDPDHLSRANLYQLLCETNWIEQDDPIVPLSMVQDKYPLLSERHEIAKQQPIDYFNILASSQEAANLRMIQYYVGLLIDMRRDYRQFYVVHTEPEAPYVQEWKKIQNIAEVMTPEQLIEELGKSPKESKIDFYEWAMPEYKVKNWREITLKGDGKSAG